MATLAEIFSIARSMKGWTLREAAKRSGVSNPLISQIETGKNLNPSWFTVLRLADALGVSLDILAKASPPPHGN